MNDVDILERERERHIILDRIDGIYTEGNLLGLAITSGDPTGELDLRIRDMLKSISELRGLF